MSFRASLIYLAIYYDQTLSLRRQVTNETMDIPKRERDRYMVLLKFCCPSYMVLVKYYQGASYHDKSKYLR